MTRPWHPTREHIVRWLKPSAESFAAAAAVYSPEVMLQLEATKGAVDGRSLRDAEVVPASRQASRGRDSSLVLFDCRRPDAPDNDALSS